MVSMMRTTVGLCAAGRRAEACKNSRPFMMGIFMSSRRRAGQIGEEAGSQWVRTRSRAAWPLPATNTVSVMARRRSRALKTDSTSGGGGEATSELGTSGGVRQPKRETNMEGKRAALGRAAGDIPPVRCPGGMARTVLRQTPRG